MHTAARPAVFPRSMTQRRAVAAVAALLAVPAVYAQAPAAPPTRFEAASIKANRSGDTRIAFDLPPGGLKATNVPLRFVIRQAYRLPESRIVGGPSWLDTDRFDIVARTAAASTPDDIRAMLRVLLADRFALAARSESRDMPIYALMRARAGSALGPNLRPSATNCADGAPRMANGRVQCGILLSQGPTGASLRAGGAAFVDFVRLLADFLNRPLVDRTELSGPFDAELQFSADRSALPGQGAPGGLATAPGGTEVPTVFTAVQEQLGLRLEATRAIVDILVVDAVTRPVEG